MDCKISNKQKKKFLQQVSADLFNLQKNDEPLVLKDYMASVYNQVMQATNNDHAKAVAYARLIPGFINLVQSRKPVVRKHIGNGYMRLILDTQDLVDDKGGAAYIENFLEVKAPIAQKLKQLNELLNEVPVVETEDVKRRNRIDFLNKEIKKVKEQIKDKEAERKDALAKAEKHIGHSYVGASFETIAQRLKEKISEDALKLESLEAELVDLKKGAKVKKQSRAKQKDSSQMSLFEQQQKDKEKQDKQSNQLTIFDQPKSKRVRPDRTTTEPTTVEEVMALNPRNFTRWLIKKGILFNGMTVNTVGRPQFYGMSLADINQAVGKIKAGRTMRNKRGDLYASVKALYDAVAEVMERNEEWPAISGQGGDYTTASKAAAPSLKEMIETGLALGKEKETTVIPETVPVPEEANTIDEIGEKIAALLNNLEAAETEAEKKDIQKEIDALEKKEDEFVPDPIDTNSPEGLYDRLIAKSKGNSFETAKLLKEAIDKGLNPVKAQKILDLWAVNSQYSSHPNLSVEQKVSIQRKIDKAKQTMTAPGARKKQTPVKKPVTKTTGSTMPQPTKAMPIDQIIKNAMMTAPASAMVDQDYEADASGVLIEAKKFFYAIKRKVLDLFSKRDEMQDTLMINNTPVYFTAMSLSKVPAEQRLASDTDLDAIVMVMTDRNGEPFTFNEDSLEQSYAEDARMVYYNLPKLEENKVDKDGNVKLNEYDVAIILNKEKEKDITYEEAKAEYIAEVKQLQQIKDHIAKDPENNTVQTIMNGGSFGKANTGYQYKQKLSDVVFEQGDFNLRVAGYEVPGVSAGMHYIKPKDFYGDAVEIQNPTVEETGMVDLFIDIMSEDFVDEFNNPVTPQRKKQIMDQFLFLSSGNKTNNPRIDIYANGEVMVYGQRYNPKTQKDELKEALRNKFTKMTPMQEIKGKPSPKANIITSLEQADPRKVNVLMTTEPSGKRHYYKVDKEEIYPKKNLIGKQIQIPSITINNGVRTLSTTPKSYENFVKENYSTINQTDSENKLVRVNAHISFELTSDGVETVEGTAMTKEQEAYFSDIMNFDAEEDDLTSDNIADNDDPYDVGDEYDAYDKLSDQKKLNKAVVQEQIDAAEKWWNAHPMSKIVPFKTMFNAVNSKNRNSVANWSVHGITLYKGSDFTDVYHEAWHAFTQTFLTKEEREGLYNETRKKAGSFTDYAGHKVSFKKATNKQLEEYLAEDFRSYMLKGNKPVKGSPKRNGIFRKILNMLKALFQFSSPVGIIQNYRSDKLINELYEKMRVGNINTMNYSVSNAQFGTLQQGIKDKEGGNGLNYQDSKVVSDMINSFFIQYANNLNSGIRSEKMAQEKATQELILVNPNASISDKKEAAKKLDEINAALAGKKTYKFSTLAFKDERFLADSYTYALKRIFGVRNNLVDQYETLNPKSAEAKRVLKDIETLTWAIQNFTESIDPTESVKITVADLKAARAATTSGKPAGVIAYHMLKSEAYMEDVVEKLDFENMSETETFLKGRNFEASGSDKAMSALAKKEIIYLMSTLNDVKWNEKTGLWEENLNRFGIPQLAPFRQVWNKTIKLLEEARTIDQMYDILQAEAEVYPPIAQLLEKMGEPVSDSLIQNTVWSNFFQVFAMTRVPLQQLTIEEEELGVYEARFGEAFGDYKRVNKKWNQQFSRTQNGEKQFIKRDSKGAYLDIAGINQKYKNSESVSGEKGIQFLRDLGLNLADNADLESDLLNDGSLASLPNTIRIKLELFEKAGNQVRSLDDFMLDMHEDEINNEFQTSLSGFQQKIYSEGFSKKYKALQQLQAKYASDESSFMVSNAEGNTQFEHSLNNSITMMLNTLNDESIQTLYDLIAIPHMEHLDPNRNSFAKRSLWLNALFDLETGARRRDSNGKIVKLNFNNLSGVLLQNLEEDGNGIASAKADAVTKLIYDFHMHSMSGVTELMRHADKSTSYSAQLTDRKQYINNTDFIGDPAIADQKMYQALVPQIIAEMERINTMVNTEFDSFAYNYQEAGKEFVAFDDVLNSSKKELEEFAKAEGFNGDNFTEFLASAEGSALRQKLYSDITAYFDKQYKQVLDVFNQQPFMANNVYQTLKADYKKVSNEFLTKEAAQDALVRSYVYNSWLHNIESINIIYGDLAQYNHAKEDFHKRNAGFGSTGNIFRTDDAILRYLNNKGRQYAKSKGYESKPFDSTFTTAVVDDSTVRSSYFKEYAEALIADEIAAGRTKKQAEEKILGKGGTMKEPTKDGVMYAYHKMDEGDAQGWISFDSYRALKIFQGNWSNKQEKMFNEILEGKKVSAAELNAFFPVYKTQYMGPLRTKVGPPIVAFHKHSLFPLIPTAIKGTNLEKLHDKMMKEGIDYVQFKSASKLGTIRKKVNGEIQNEPLYKKGTRELTDVEFTPNVIHLQYFKDQLEIAPKYKKRVVFSTQLRKLIEDGLYERGKPTSKLHEKLAKRYENNIRKLTQIKKEELLKEAGWTVSKDKRGNDIVSGDLENLLEFVKKELSRQDLATHEIDFIDIVNGELKHDLSMMPSAEKVEKLLSALVNNRLIKQKVNGENSVQVSGAGYENAIEAAKRNYTNPTQAELEQYGTNDLPTYRKGKDGKTQAMKVKVALQGNFKSLLNLKDINGERIGTIQQLNKMLKNEEWLAMDNNREAITMVGVRIPVQGMNSMEFMEVYEFLPEEAGNIIVPPAEIVAKSGADFDIDKMTVMMPNIKSNGSIVNENTFDAAYEKYRTAVINEAINPEDFRRMKRTSDPAADKLLSDIFGINMEGLVEDAEAILFESGELMTKEEFGKTKTGIKLRLQAAENDLIADVAEILSLPDNYTRLIRPNGTDILDPIADELSSLVMEYNPKQRTNGTTQKNISPTRVFEVMYNMYKHTSNSIGKATLGLGAIDNTYNIVLNRIGAYMNPTVGGISTELYEKAKAKAAQGKELTTYESNALNNYQKQTIHMPHNKMNVNGEDAISLSDMKDANGEHSIADVINQMMNGWVDIAKDAWIFNIQGNKEVSPTLLFMIQAGVPVRQAIMFASMPMVRQYVTEQKLAKSTFAKALGTAPADPNKFRSAAARKVLMDPANGFNLTSQQVDDDNQASTLRQLGRALEQSLSSNTNMFDADKLKGKIEDYAKSKGTYAAGKMERAAFVHFLEIEAMAKEVTRFKSTMDFDTSKYANLFEASEAIKMKNELMQSRRLPGDLVEKVLNDSPIGSFHVQPFQLTLWNRLFKVRNHPAVNKILNKAEQIEDKEARRAAQDNAKADVVNTFGENNEEKFNAEFRNDLVNFMFQNSLSDFNSRNINGYNGYRTEDGTLQEVTSLSAGAFVKDGTLYYDMERLKADYLSNRGSKSGTKPNLDNRGIANVFSGAFNSFDQYTNFVFERETLRASNPLSKVKSQKEYITRLGRIQSRYTKAQLTDQVLQQLEKEAYEMYIRDKALDNTNNFWKIFQSEDTYADQYLDLINDHPYLKDSYDVLNHLIVNSSETTGFTNLRLDDPFLEVDNIELYQENIKNLSDPTVIKVSDPVENLRISNYFKRMHTVAFLQSGLNSTSTYSLTRIVPQDTFTRVVEKTFKDFTDHLDQAEKARKTPAILEHYYDMFVENNKNRDTRIRGKNYNTPATLEMSKAELKEEGAFDKIYSSKRLTKEPLVKAKHTLRVTPDNLDTEQANMFVEDESITPKFKVYSNNQITVDNVDELAIKDPNRVIVYNDAMNDTDRASKGDNLFAKVDAPQNLVGIPTKNSFVGTIDQYIEDDIDPNDPEKTIPNQQAKAIIDKAIANLKEYKKQGKELFFNGNGYGTEMIETFDNGEFRAPKTFLYLSEQLFKNFGYINPGYLSTRTGKAVVQSTQPITDQDVIDALNHCF